MSDIESRLSSHFELTPLAGPLVIAWSGGLDSSVLLHACLKLGIRLIAIHVNHGLQQAAPLFEQHCVAQANILGIRLQTIQLSGLPTSGAVETAAREARYSGIFAFMKQEGLVDLALGHHRADQAETVFLQLLRGSGYRGLAGMPACGPAGVNADQHPDIVLHRPLLPISKRQLHDYATKNQIDFIEDPTNADSDYRRNWLRNRVMPELETRYPQAELGLLRLGEFFCAHYQVADSLTEDLCRLVCKDDKKLELSRWQSLRQESRREVLRHWLSLAGIRIPKAKLIELERQLSQSTKGGVRQVGKGWRVHVSKMVATLEQQIE